MARRRSQSRVGDQIRTALHDARMTQKALADALGVTPGAVSNWIKGVRNPEDSELERIAERTGKPVEFFHGLTPEEQGAVIADLLIRLQASIRPGQTLLDALLTLFDQSEISPSEQRQLSAATDQFLRAIQEGRVPGADRLTPAQLQAAQSRLRRYAAARRGNGR